MTADAAPTPATGTDAYAFTSAKAASAGTAPAPSRDMTVLLYWTALGQVRTEHYLKAFERMDGVGRALAHWNWVAAFFTLGWLLYWRLWSAAGAYLGALLVGAGLLGFALNSPVQTGLPAPVLAGLVLLPWLLLFAVPGLYGNALLHRQIRQRIDQAVKSSPTMREATALLHRQAGSKRRLGAVIALLGLTSMLLAAALLWWRFSHWGSATQRPADSQPSVIGAIPVQPAAPSPPPAPAPTPAAAPDPAPLAAAHPPEITEPTITEKSTEISTKTLVDTAPKAIIKEAKNTPSEASSNPPAAAAVTTPAPAPEPLPTPTPAKPQLADTVPIAKAPATPKPPKAQTPQKSPKTPVAPQTTQKPTNSGDDNATAADTATPAASQRSLVINVGLFADPSNAQRVQSQLRGAGLPVLADSVSRADGSRLQRVRVGPFASSAQANEAVQKVRSLGLDAQPAVRKGR